MSIQSTLSNVQKADPSMKPVNAAMNSKLGQSPAGKIGKLAFAAYTGGASGFGMQAMNTFGNPNSPAHGLASAYSSISSMGSNPQPTNAMGSDSVLGGNSVASNFGANIPDQESDPMAAVKRRFQGMGGGSSNGY